MTSVSLQKVWLDTGGFCLWGDFFMILSLALIFLVGMTLGRLFERCKLPRLVGMMLGGMLLGPSVLNGLDETLLAVSPALRQFALIVILLKAGLSLNLEDLKRVGRPAVLMSFVPAVFEIAAVVLIAPRWLGISVLDAAVLGAVLGAVSPAVVVPKMVSLMERGYGTDQGIPQMILAGASLDDVFVIVLFSSFLGLEQGNQLNLGSFTQIPVSIVLGLALGVCTGFFLAIVLKRGGTAGQRPDGAVDRHGLSPYSFGNPTGGDRCRFRAVGSHGSGHGTASEGQSPCGGARQSCVSALDGSRGSAVCAGGRGSGYSLCGRGRRGRAGGYCGSFGCAQLRSAGVPDRHQSLQSGTAVLCIFLFAKGHRTGRHWRRAFGYGIGLRANRPYSGRSFHPDHCAPGRISHGINLP